MRFIEDGGYAYFILGMVVAWGVPLTVAAIVLYLHTRRKR